MANPTLTLFAFLDPNTWEAVSRLVGRVRNCPHFQCGRRRKRGLLTYSVSIAFQHDTHYLAFSGSLPTTTQRQSAIMPWKIKMSNQNFRVTLDCSKERETMNVLHASFHLVAIRTRFSKLIRV